MLAEKVALLEFEEVRREYGIQDARGIPMSVHEQYRDALAEMRFRIRESRRAGRNGKKLGELLVESGVLDRQRLQLALTRQRQRGKGELLGEVLLVLGLIREEAVLSALRMQRIEDQTAETEAIELQSLAASS